MPKVRLAKNSLNFNIAAISSGTYSNLASLTIDSLGRINTINTTSIVQGSGNVTAISGDGITTTATIINNSVVLSLLPFTGTVGTFIAPNSFALDKYSRVTAVTTASVPNSGTYIGITSLTVDGGGRITSITTGSVAPTGYSNTTATSIKYGGITQIQQQAETLYNLGVTSGVINLDITSSTNFYFIPNGSFQFNVIDTNNLLTTMNPFLASGGVGTVGSYPALTVNVIVDNPSGWSYAMSQSGVSFYTNPYGSSLTYAYTNIYVNGVAWSSWWLAGIIPTGSINKTEIYSLTFSAKNTTLPNLNNAEVLASLTVYG